ncbi:MAG: Ig-like domain-containing protein [Methanobacteriota archaeon]
MKTKNIASVISMLVIIGTVVAVSGTMNIPVKADRNFPDPEQSFVTLTNTNQRGLCTCFRGDVTAQYNYLRVTVKDVSGTPMVGIPANMFSFSVSAGAGTHSFGTISIIFTPVDSQTNANGEIRFTLKGGSCSIVGNVIIQATVMGMQLSDSDSLSCNSADMNYDGAMSLPDISLFASKYIADPTYNWEADLSWDGAESLPDISILSTHYFHV